MNFQRAAVLALIGVISFSCANIKRGMNSEAFLRQKMQKARVVGLQAAVIKKGKLVYTASMGRLRVDRATSVNDSTLFMIASSTKPITALTVLKMIDEYHLSLDVDINAYLPFKITNPYRPNVKITFRNLLTHTSTIKDNWQVLDSLYTLPKGGDSNMGLKEYVYENLCANGKFFDELVSFQDANPSEYWEYANTGYALLGLLVEEITKKSFDQYCREKVLLPLGMKNTYWFLKDIPHGNIANPHEIVDNGHNVLPHYGYPTYPDGQLRTTVSDYAKFLLLILNKGKAGGEYFIQEPIMAEFLKIQYPEANKWQAIAWNYNEFENFIFYLHFPHLPAHTGGDPGITTAVMFDPQIQGAVILFLNTRLNDFKGVKAMYLDVLKRLAKEAGI